MSIEGGIKHPKKSYIRYYRFSLTAGSSHPSVMIMDVEVFSWWSFLRTVAAFNIVAWVLSAQALRRRQYRLPEGAHTVRQLQVLLSAG